MLAPQQDEEVGLVVEALRRLDLLLDIVWNPRAFVERTTYDATGRSTKTEYAARWQVVRRDVAASIHAERDYTIICTVTDCDRSGRFPIMIERGAYAPVGPWLVEYMHVWDAAQRTMVGALDRLWADHEKIDQMTHDRDAHQEAAERIYREHGSEYWMGGAQGRASPEAAAALFGESSPRGSPPTTDPAPPTDPLPPPGRARVAAALAASTP